MLHFLSILVGIPRDVSFTVVQDTFLEVEGIVAVHNLRIWGLTTDKTALAVHLAIGKLQIDDHLEGLNALQLVS